MHLKQVNEMLDHQITGGSEYQWSCYPHARYLDYETDHAHATVLFSTETQEVYEATVNDKDNDHKPYRWINPEYKDAYVAECESRDIDHKIAWDSTEWYDLEVDVDWLEKAAAIMRGESFDERVQVPLNLNESEMLELCMQAHKRDMTLNQYVEYILQIAIAYEHKLVNEITD